MTGDDEDNIVISQIAKEGYRVPKAIARVNDPRNQPYFDLLGIRQTVCATSGLLGLVEHEVPEHGLVRLLELRGEGLELVELHVAARRAGGREARRRDLAPRGVEARLRDAERSRPRSRGRHRDPARRPGRRDPEARPRGRVRRAVVGCEAVLSRPQARLRKNRGDDPRRARRHDRCARRDGARGEPVRALCDTRVPLRGLILGPNEPDFIQSCSPRR